jgi:hypothetical protein
MKAIAAIERLGINLIASSKFVLICGVLLFSGFSVSQDSRSHIVTGIVTAPDGSRIEGACVSALPMESTAGNSICTNTDHWGRFTLTLHPGKYVLRAKAETAGYPDPMFLLGADRTAEFPEIVVGESDVSGVKVVLGLRGGILEGEIRDSRDDSPIPGAKLRISDLNNPAAYVEVFSNKDGRFQFTVPGKALSLSVTAKGYKAAEVQEFTLSAGEHRTLDIQLDKTYR